MINIWFLWKSLFPGKIKIASTGSSHLNFTKDINTVKYCYILLQNNSSFMTGNLLVQIYNLTISRPNSPGCLFKELLTDKVPGYHLLLSIQNWFLCQNKNMLKYLKKIIIYQVTKTILLYIYWENGRVDVTCSNFWKP